MSDTPSPSLPERRPAVGRSISDRGVWIFAAAVIAGAGLLLGSVRDGCEIVR